ncbi:hypothetical protein BDP27DRAFT_1510302, partial [Rhodocollybia butyracea]
INPFPQGLKNHPIPPLHLVFNCLNDARCSSVSISPPMTHAHTHINPYVVAPVTAEKAYPEFIFTFKSKSTVSESTSKPDIKSDLQSASAATCQQYNDFVFFPRLLKSALNRGSHAGWRWCMLGRRRAESEWRLGIWVSHEALELGGGWHEEEVEDLVSDFRKACTLSSRIANLNFEALEGTKAGGYGRVGR